MGQTKLCVLNLIYKSKPLATLHGTTRLSYFFHCLLCLCLLVYLQHMLYDVLLFFILFQLQM